MQLAIIGTLVEAARNAYPRSQELMSALQKVRSGNFWNYRKLETHLESLELWDFKNSIGEFGTATTKREGPTEVLAGLEKGSQGLHA